MSLSLFEFLDRKFKHTSIELGKKNGYSIILGSKIQATHALISFLKAVTKPVMVASLLGEFWAYKLGLSKEPTDPIKEAEELKEASTPKLVTNPTA